MTIRTAGTVPANVCLTDPGSQTSRVTSAAPTTHIKATSKLISQAFGALMAVSMALQRERRAIEVHGSAAVNA